MIQTQEKDPIPGRHELIFPMFEFESKGDINDMRKMEEELLIHLGFGAPDRVFYNSMCDKYDVQILENREETVKETIHRKITDKSD